VLAHRSLCVRMGRPHRDASLEVLSPSAPAHRAALSGVAGRRTIPLRL
jgi:hypothetical protein